MIQKTFEIIKRRWPEVMLLVVSQAAMMLLFEEMVRRWGLAGDGMAEPPAPQWAMFLFGMAVTGIVIVWHLLLLGFLKTAVTSGATPQEPLALITSGRPYLWRILLVQLMVAAGLWIITGAMISGYFLATRRTASSEPPGWLIEIAGAVATVLLFKPVFLIPAFIVTLDLRVVESLFQMLHARMADARQVLKAVLLGYAAVTTLGVLLTFAPEEGIGMYAASGVNYLAKSMNMVILLTTAVLWSAARFLPPELPTKVDE